MLKRMTEKDGLSPGASWCVALAPAASGNFLWFGLIGMEHLLFILLSLGVMAAWFHESTLQNGIRRLLLPLLCFLLVITRPEGICLIALLFLFRGAAGCSIRNWMTATAGAIFGGAVSAGVNWMTGHHLTPLTMQGRNGVISSTSWAGLHLPFIGHSFARLLSVWGIDIPQRVLHGRGLLIGIPLALFVSSLLVLAVRRLRLLHANRLLLLCTWAGTIEVLYFVMLPTPGHGGRYIAVVVMLFLPLVFLGFREMLALSPLSSRAAWMVVSLAGVITIALSTTVWTSVAAADIEQINTEHGAMATWIEQSLPPSSVTGREIAIYDIGRMGYQMHGNLIDLGGLVDSKFHSYLVRHRTADYLQEHGVKYVVIPGFADPSSEYYERSLWLDKADGANLTLLHSICADAAVARLASTASETAAPCQRLYSIGYGVPPS